jgi:GH43 family beta-xylosidase
VPYCNPVYDRYFADPFVLRTREGYFAVGTGSVVDGLVFELLTSENLVDWTSRGGALRGQPDELGTDCWAPEVAECDDRWWMYYSIGNDDKAHHLRVAVADGPLGPYVDCGRRLSQNERFAIDPHPFRDRDGTWYLFYARDVLEGERVGTMLAVDVLEDMTSLRGDPRTILPPSADWQLFLRGREMYGQVYDWHTLEGPFVCERAGRYYCFFSGGNWKTAGYGVSYAVADHPLGPWSEPSGNTPLMATVPGKVLGPGHVSIVTTPEGQDVLVYHAWDAKGTRRRMCIDALNWSTDGPQVDGPSSEPRLL